MVLLVAAVPFAAKQTEHLTAGGFTVPGSGSDAVDGALADFEGAQRETLAVVVARREGASAADVRAPGGPRRRDRREPAPRRAVRPRRGGREARARRDSPIAIATLDVTGSQDDAADLAVDLREELGVGDGAANDGTQTYLVGQQALWAGMQDLSKEDLEAAEATGFPIVLLILLAVFGSLAAAAAAAGARPRRA